MKKAVDRQSTDSKKESIISDRIFNFEETGEEVSDLTGYDLPTSLRPLVKKYEEETIEQGIDEAIESIEKVLTHTAGRATDITAISSGRTHFGGPDTQVYERFMEILGEEHGEVAAEAFEWHRETKSQRPFVIVEDEKIDRKMDDLDAVVEEVYTRHSKFEIFYPEEY